MGDVVQEIKERTDLVELISGYITLRRAGKNWKGLCPFHAEKTPSFHVDPERGFWRCYGCNAGGDAFRFVERIENLTFIEAAEKLARRLGLEFVPRGGSPERASERQRLLAVTALAERFFREQLARSPRALNYLRERGLSPDTVGILERFQLGYAPGGWEALLQYLRAQRVPVAEMERAGLVTRGANGLRDRFVDRLIFPIADAQGQTIAFAGRVLDPEGVPKYLNSPETPLFNKGRLWYGLHLAREGIRAAGYAVAVEGYIDVITCHQAGILHVVAGMGTAITEAQTRALRRYTDRLTLVYDGDSAGLAAALRAGPMFEEAGLDVRVAALPPGEDPDTLVRAGGAAALHAAIESAEPLLEHRIGLIRQRYNLLDAGQRLAMVREAARAIAESRSPLTRQAGASRLGEIVAGLATFGGVERQMDEQAALLAEVRSRTLSGLQDAGRPGQPGAAPRQRGAARRGPARRETPKGAPPGGPDGLALAQRWVLQAVLSQPEWLPALRERLRPEDFPDEQCRRLAMALLGNNEGESAEPRTLLRDPSFAEEISALLVRDEASIDEVTFQASMAFLEKRAKERRFQALQQEFDKGTLSRNDQRYSEYLQLVRELKE
ncbi:MAG: DNA primase [Armatimonadetes bacterium]|nr:DNA primase [Armatimonadota bacterium]